MMKVAIIGSGIGGMASALWLSKKNYKITLFDKYNPLEFNTNTGLSFNYTINLRGKYSLKKLDLWEDIQHNSIRLTGRIIHSSSLKIYQKYGPSSRSSLYSIPRHKLIKIFFDKIITLSNIDIKFNKEITNISYNNDSCYISYRDSISKIIHIQEFDFIIASDGVNSQVRSIFADRLQWSLEVFPWHYEEFKLNSNEVKKRKLSLSSLHIWSSKESLCVGIPNQDKSISLLYCASNNKNFSLKAKECIKDLFGEVKTLNNFDEEKRLGKFVAVKLNKWFIENKIIFLGDSAHGIFPFYGQGMNAALEDSKCLAEMLESFPTSREKAFKLYYEIRKPQTDILFKLSNKHFYILKNKGKSILYNTKYRLDIFLHTILPKFWFHEYTMMSNSLADIKKISRRLSAQRLYILFPLYWVIFLWAFFIEITDRIKRNFAEKI